MKTINLIIIAAALALFFAGCSTDRVAKPSNVTLVEALRDVGAGLAAFKAAELEMVDTNAYLRQAYGTNGDFITGLMPSELDVTFNVTESASDKNELALDLHTPTVVTAAGAKLGNTLDTQAAASRGNQVTLKFNSIFFSPTTVTTSSTNGSKVSVETRVTDPKTLEAFCRIIGLGDTTTNPPPAGH